MELHLPAPLHKSRRELGLSCLSRGKSVWLFPSGLSPRPSGTLSWGQSYSSPPHHHATTQNGVSCVSHSFLQTRSEEGGSRNRRPPNQGRGQPRAMAYHLESLLSMKWPHLAVFRGSYSSGWKSGTCTRMVCSLLPTPPLGSWGALRRSLGLIGTTHGLLYSLPQFFLENLTATFCPLALPSGCVKGDSGETLSPPDIPHPQMTPGAVQSPTHLSQQVRDAGTYRAQA